MKQEKTHRAARFGKTLFLSATVGGSKGHALRLRLLVDTGASYTILPLETLKRLGYDTYHSSGQVWMTSANGVVVAPFVTVSWFNCIGQLLKNFPVVAHTIPEAAFDGVLGMDFLTRCRAIIAVAEAEIRCQKPKAKRS